MYGVYGLIQFFGVGFKRNGVLVFIDTEIAKIIIFLELFKAVAAKRYKSCFKTIIISVVFVGYIGGNIE